MASGGFALISVISLIVLLALVAVALLTMSTVHTRTASLPSGVAKENAKLALMEALGELQRSAGHDQRVTATAELGDATPQAGRENWIGVWDTSQFDPSDRDDKVFLKWLVSSSNQNSLTSSDANDASLSSPLTIFDGMGGSEDVVVDRVPIGDANGTRLGSYAYWVQDNGLKAQACWHEATITDTNHKQAVDLSVARGPDLGTFSAPSSSDSSSPLDADSSEDFLANLEKITSLNDLALANNATGAGYLGWRKTYAHDLTASSRAVLSDTKRGGLQRDLSLAFEMDGEDEAENARNFNDQSGEFVASTGGSERLDSSTQVSGLPVKARYLHRDTQSSRGPFSGDIVSSQSVMRGPTWWALRDYANLYKSLKKSGSSYELSARAYYPNADNNEILSEKLTVFDRNSAQYHLENDIGTGGSNGRFIHKPAKSNYAPVSLGCAHIFSLGEDSDELVLMIDSLFYLWNPYNHRITCDNLAVNMHGGLPGVVKLKVADVDYQVDLREAIRDEFPGDIEFLIKGPSGSKISLDPGEVIIATPTSNLGETNIGHNYSITSGMVIRNLNDGSPITPGSSDEVGYRYVYDIGSESSRAYHQLFLLDQLTSLSDFNSGDWSGQELHYSLATFHALRDRENGIMEYISLEAEDPDLDTSVASLRFDAIEGSKIPFGLSSTLSKPGIWGGNNPNPVEVFSRFNPNPIVNSRDYDRICAFNQVNTIACSANINDILNNFGVRLGPDHNAYWGESFDEAGSTHVVLSAIPTAPLMSIASLSHANVSTMATDPFRPIGNSWSSPFTPVDSVYGVLDDPLNDQVEIQATMQDLCWLVNDALFDRYFFSGLAPHYTINGGGYSATGTLNRTLTNFYGSNYKDARANPAFKPILPTGVNSASAVSELDSTSGYKKIAAYAMLDGAFNINSLSVDAWTALLRANRGINLDYSDGTSAAVDDTPFPSSTAPANSSLGNGDWSGFSDLSNNQIRDLAQEIVTLIRNRGPFMSLSDFVNRQMGQHTGVIQAAIDIEGLNNTISTNTGGRAENLIYGNIVGDADDADDADDTERPPYFIYRQSGNRSSTTGSTREINQAEILMPIAPRLRPRSDTFTIRAYGDTVDRNGNPTETAYCEAVVQRIPEYTDPTLNEPWDEPLVGYDQNGDVDQHNGDPNDFSDRIRPEDSRVLQGINKTLGRKFKIISFRWLSQDEI